MEPISKWQAEGHKMDVVKVQQQLRDFAKERDWEQFHTPKNLASALAVEAAELLENFQWLTDEQARSVKDDAERMRRIEEEVADVTLYLLRLADVLSLNLQDVVDRKLKINADKYPADKARGNAKKYNVNRPGFPRHSPGSLRNAFQTLPVTADC